MTEVLAKRGRLIGINAGIEPGAGNRNIGKTGIDEVGMDRRIDMDQYAICGESLGASWGAPLCDLGFGDGAVGGLQTRSRPLPFQAGLRVFCWGWRGIALGAGTARQELLAGEAGALLEGQGGPAVDP